MEELAIDIRQTIDTLAEQYSRDLEQIEGYAALSDDERLAVARHDLDLLAACLEAGDEAAFISFIRERAGVRLGETFEATSLLQLLRALERIVSPLVEGVEAAKFLWRTFSQAREVVTQRITDALHASEMASQHILDDLPVGVFRTTPKGRLVEANPAFLTIVGYDSLESVNRVGVPRLYADLADRQRLLSALRDGAVVGYETQFQRPTGEVVPVSISVRMFYDESGAPQFLEGIVEDITERRQAEHALREEKALMDALMDNIPESIYFKDRQGRLVRISRYMMQSLGLDDRSQVIGKTDVDLFEGVFGQKALASDMRVMETGEPVEGLIEDRPLGDGEVNWTLTTKAPVCDDEGEVVGLVGITREINELMETQKALRESEQLFRSIVENAPTGIFIVDDNYRFTYVNEELTDILGYSSEEIKGMDFREVLTEEGKRLAGDRYVRRRRGEDVPSRYELDVIRKDGDVRRVELSSATIQDTAGNIRTVAQVLDVTERREVEKTLQESEQRYRTLFEGVPVGLYRSTAAGEFVDANPAMVDMLAFPDRKTLLESNAFDLFVDPEDRRRERKLLEENGLVRGLEMKLKRYDGEHIWARDTVRVVEDEAGEVLWQGSLMDITERKEAEQSLRESEERFRVLFESANDAIFLMEENRFIDCNDKTLEMFDCTREQILGESPARFSPASQPDGRDSRAESLKRIRAALEGEPQFFEWQHIRYDGTPFYADVSLSRVEIAGDTLVQAIVRDITERKHLERDIQQSLERRGRQVATGTEIAQEIAAAPALDELFNRVVTLVKERFDYYHAQIFRYEPVLDAVLLVVGYGDAGEEMLAEGHRIEMGHGVVGTAAATGESVLASAVTRDPDWVPNPHLPETQGELAVPIKWQDEVLGILDVQSDVGGALTEEDQILLEGLCGQIAIAIESTRLRERMEENLREMEYLTQTMSQESWEAFRQETGVLGYLFDRANVVQADDIWLPEMRLAVEQRELVDDQPTAVVAPLSARGEFVGLLGVEDDPENPLSSDDLALVEDVSEQVSRALESARLFEQTQIALAEQRRLGAILEAIPDFVGVANAEGQVTYLNPGARELIGLDMEANLRDVVIADVHPTWAADMIFEEALPVAREEGTWSGEAALLTQDGREIPVLQVIVAHENPSGALEYFTVARDITDRKLAEAEREETLRELDRLTRAMSREGWEAYRREVESPGYRFTLTDVVRDDDFWAPAMKPAVERLEAVSSSDLDNGGQASAVAPVTVHGEVIGALGVQDDPQQPLSPDELALVEAVSAQVAQALESARLFEETQMALSEAETLNRMAQNLGQMTEEREMFEFVLPEYLRYLGFSQGGVLVFDQDAKHGTLAALMRDGQLIEPGRRIAVAGNLPVEEMLQTQEPVVIDEGAYDDVWMSARGLTESLDYRTRLLVPIVIRGEVVGALGADATETAHKFVEREITLVEAVADQLAIALANLRLLEETQTALDELEATQRLYVREQWERFVPERVAPLYERTESQASSPDKAAPVPVEEAMAQQKVVEQQGEDGEAELVVPLTLRGEVIGALGLQRPRDVTPAAAQNLENSSQWTGEEITLIESIAEELAMAIEEARLMEETQRRAQRDRLVADITSKVRASSDIEMIMSTAVRELGAALGVDRARVQLGAEEENEDRA